MPGRRERGGPFGKMSPSSQLLSGLLLFGWVISTADSTTDSECQNVTDEMAQDELLPIYCTPEELQTALGSEVLLSHLGLLTQYAFTEEQLLVLKQKLDELYPDGYPASILPDLGGLLGVMGLEDIKKWSFNSSKILASLLDNAFSPEMAIAILHRYMDCGGPLNAEALKAIGTKYLCLLDPEQLQKIDENAFDCSSPLDPSGCNQTTKDILYAKAKRAFSDRHNPPQYYICIKPYLEGAPGEDLRALSKDNVNMDITTFTKMKWDSIMKLKPKEVKGLLGKHLPDLKTWENNSVVKDWIVRQEQRELDSLEIELTGGIPEGYVTIMHKNNRPPETSGVAGGPTLHLFLLLLLTPLLTAFF